MVMPSKLTTTQWEEVQRRLPTEGASALGREFGISEAAIRQKFGSRTKIGSQNSNIRKTAKMLADAHIALDELPPRQRHIAVGLAEQLRNMSQSLAMAGELGAKTAHRLHALANTEVNKVDDANPLNDESITALKSVGVLTKLANESSQIAVNLLSANKDMVNGNKAGDLELPSGGPVYKIINAD